MILKAEKDLRNYHRLEVTKETMLGGKQDWILKHRNDITGKTKFFSLQ